MNLRSTLGLRIALVVFALIALEACSANPELDAAPVGDPRPSAAEAPAAAFAAPPSEATAPGESHPPSATSERSEPYASGGGRGPQGQSQVPAAGSYLYRTHEGSHREYIVGGVVRSGAGWTLDVTDGQPQRQRWENREAVVVSEQFAGETCYFNPPPVVHRLPLTVGVTWSSSSECRLGETDTYVTRDVRGRVAGTREVTTPEGTFAGWVIEESIQTVVESRLPAEVSTPSPPRQFRSVDERHQTRVLSQRHWVPLRVEGRLKHTNPDGSVYEGAFEYELVSSPPP